MIYFLQTLEMSAASPAWQLYTAQMDAMVLMSLKASILTSLDAMYATVACLEGADSTQVPRIRWLGLYESSLSTDLVYKNTRLTIK